MPSPSRSLLPYVALVFALVAATPVWGGAGPAHPGAGARAERSAKASKGGKSKGGKNSKGGKGGKNSKGGKNGKSKGGKNSKPDGVGPFKKKDYPTSLRNRPLVLPNEMGEVSLDLGVGRTLGATGLSTNLDFDYGIADVAEIGASTGIGISGAGLGWNGLTLQGHGLAYDSKDTDFAPGLLVPINTLGGQLTMAAIVDLPTRIVLPEGMFIRFGQGALPVYLAPNFGLALAGNGGFGIQVDNKTAFFADLNAFTLSLAPDVVFSGPWNNLNVSLGGQYSPTRQWDAGGILGLSNAFGVEDGFGFSIAGFGSYRF